MIQKNIISPLQKFVKIESFSGILLLFATVSALVWANSPFSESYHHLWEFKLGFKSEVFELVKPLHLWVNDGLMAIFFFLIGLEIKREFLIGELNSPKKIAFPLIGAIGGMVIPVAFFLMLNKNPEALSGWGIPMATDIAFSLAILKLLGNRVPLSLKVFLTAFAIVDDLGAVLVIALFYSNQIKVGLIVIALLMLGVLYFLSYKGIYSKYLLLISGVVIWVLFLKSGIHPTIAGIMLAFAVPVQQKTDKKSFLTNLEEITGSIKKSRTSDQPILTHKEIEHIDDLEEWISNYQSPLQHLEHRLHNWVAYFIIPIFALANAGVSLGSETGLDQSLLIIIAISLIFGKSIGISLFVLLTDKLKIITIPNDISTRQIIGVGFLAGIGFTMSIFIANLAFVNQPLFIDSAKIGILIGSTISAIIGYFILKPVRKYGQDI